jgi:hypothetical protein
VTPAVNPLIVNEVDVDVRRTQVTPPSSEYSYAVMDDPPLNGAVTRTDNDLRPEVTVSLVGADGTTAGTPVTDDVDDPTPAAFTARTRTEYDLPFTNPANTCDRASAPTDAHDRPPSIDTWNPVNSDPPSLGGATHVTVNRRSAGVTTTPVGTPGTVRGAASTTADPLPAPCAFTARTATRYERPFTNPDTVNDVADDVRRTHDTPPSSEYS